MRNTKKMHVGTVANILQSCNYYQFKTLYNYVLVEVHMHLFHEDFSHLVHWVFKQSLYVEIQNGSNFPWSGTANRGNYFIVFLVFMIPSVDLLSKLKRNKPTSKTALLTVTLIYPTCWDICTWYLQTSTYAQKWDNNTSSAF